MNVVRKDFRFSCFHNGEERFACFWRDTEIKEQRGIVQIVHGMAEHILRYEEFAIFLAQEGFLVCGSDLAGHGRSVRSEEEFGFFGTEEGWLSLEEDLFCLMQKMKKQFSGLPYFLIGHSMGSFLAREFVFRHGEELSGAVFLGTSGGHPLVNLAITLSEQGISKKGPLKKGTAIYHLAFDAFNFKFMPRRTPFDWLSRDKKEVDRFLEDEKCGFVFTYSGFHDLFILLKRVNEEAWARGVPKELPILLLSGGDDPVGDFGKGVIKVKERLEQAGCTRVTYRIYEGGRHELLHESNRRTVFRFLLQWMEKQI